MEEILLMGLVGFAIGWVTNDIAIRLYIHLIFKDREKLANMLGNMLEKAIGKYLIGKLVSKPASNYLKKYITELKDEEVKNILKQQRKKLLLINFVGGIIGFAISTVLYFISFF